MAKIAESAEWSEDIYQITRADKVEGGTGGVANLQAKQLAARTQFLRIMLEGSADYNEFTFFKTADDQDGTKAGLAATNNGKTFRVAQGPSSDDAFIYYLNDNGAALPVAMYAGKGYVDRRLVPGAYRSSFFPVLHDNNDVVPVWLDKGLLDAAGLGPVLQGFVSDIPNAYAKKHLQQHDFSARYFPVLHDEKGNVPIWLDEGLLDAAGLGPVLQRYVKTLIGEGSGGTSGAGKYYIRGDLFKFIFKRGQVFNGDAASVNIGWTGDSWTEKNTIPQALIDVLGGKFKDAGWISCSDRADGVMAGISPVKAVNFKKYDGGSNSINQPQYGSGPDGNAYYNVDAVGSLTWTGVPATDLSLFYYDGSGTFTIIIDDQQTVSINGGNSGEVKKYDVSGLSGDKHKVVIGSTGAGVVSILGMYAKNANVRSGITVSRMGNGGAIGSDYLNFSKWIKPIAQSIDLDLLFIVLGTNDFRLSKGIEQYKNGIKEIIRQYREATPGICICLVSPGQCNANGTPALSEYDNAMRQLADEYELSFISGYQVYPKVYDNSQGGWQDALHMSSKGAYVLAKTIKDNLFQE